MKPPVEWMAEVLRAHNTVCEVSRGHAFFNEVADALIELSSKLDRVSKLLSDWEEAERQGLGLSILGGINQLREALK